MQGLCCEVAEVSGISGVGDKRSRCSKHALAEAGQHGISHGGCQRPAFLCRRSAERASVAVIGSHALVSRVMSFVP